MIGATSSEGFLVLLYLRHAAEQYEVSVGLIFNKSAHLCSHGLTLLFIFFLKLYTAVVQI